MIDHIIDTNQGIIGEQGGSIRDIFDNPKEMQNLQEALSGFSHRQYFDKNGQIIAFRDGMGYFAVWATAGIKPECLECKETFKHIYRLYLHLLETGHKTRYSPMEDVIDKTTKLKHLENRYF